MSLYFRHVNKAKNQPKPEQLPHSIEAERHVIGCLLLNEEAWFCIEDVVAVADFYVDKNRSILRHILGLIKRGVPADVLSVAQSIADANETEKAGGFADLAEIANYSEPVSKIRHNAKIVREKSLLRQLAAVAENIAASVHLTDDFDTNKIIGEAESKLQEIAAYGARLRPNCFTIQDCVAHVVENIEELYGREATSQIPSGFSDLDNLISGLTRGNLIVLAGRPSMGKTTFALNIAEHVGVHLKRPVAIFSLKETSTQLAQRLLSSVSQINQSKLINPTENLTDNEWDKMTVALTKLHEATIHIEETPFLNVREMRERVRRLSRANGKLGLIVIDHLEINDLALMHGSQNTGVSEVMSSIKSMAKELDVPVLVLTKLSRRVDERNDKRPYLGDLSNSNVMEKYADLIIMMYRDEYYNNHVTDNKAMAEVFVRMNRNGPTGSVRLTCLNECVGFTNFISEY